MLSISATSRRKQRGGPPQEIQTIPITSATTNTGMPAKRDPRASRSQRSLWDRGGAALGAGSPVLPSRSGLPARANYHSLKGEEGHRDHVELARADHGRGVSGTQYPADRDGQGRDQSKGIGVTQIECQHVTKLNERQGGAQRQWRARHPASAVQDRAEQGFRGSRRRQSLREVTARRPSFLTPLNRFTGPSRLV